MTTTTSPSCEVAASVIIVREIGRLVDLPDPVRPGGRAALPLAPTGGSFRVRRLRLPSTSGDSAGVSGGTRVRGSEGPLGELDGERWFGHHVGVTTQRMPALLDLCRHGSASASSMIRVEARSL